MAPTPAPTITLTTAIADVPGVKPAQVEGFLRLGVRCVADLLRHLPLRYEHEWAEETIEAVNRRLGSAHGGEANIAVRGEVSAIRVARARKPRIEATLEDGTGTLRVTWFNAPWLRGKLHPGHRIRVWGKATRHGDYLQMVNPRWSMIDAQHETAPRAEGYQPIYPANERVGSETISRAVQSILEPALSQLPDHLHDRYRQQAALPELAEAYRMVHRPLDEHETKRGMRRLAFDELLLLELAVMLKRQHRRRTLRAIPLRHTPAIDEHITARFPFPLTASQRTVIEEIAADLREETPMNRLLQGDVGSGKTVVALYAMLLAVASGHQAALMAPTELLAEQHEASIRDLLQGGRVTVELLTGSRRPRERAEIAERLAAGEIDLLIGTHALLTEAVAFKSLAVAVIDEQHRFGVHQRAGLRAKAAEPNSSPHVLVMTATPIPRTLSLTVFGDLDVSVISELPPGRTPVITRHVGMEQRDSVYGYLNQRLEQGEQGYIVVPVIDESTSGLTDVESHLRWLSEGHLRGRRLAALHGRLPREEREAVMDRFRRGEIQCLIATTVIEVGVDVPAATMMVIEHAERFGLAQLHQLRGRVGRSERQGLCTLIADATTSEARRGSRRSSRPPTAS